MTTGAGIREDIRVVYAALSTDARRGTRRLSPGKFSAGTSVKGKAAQTVRRPGAIKLVTSCQALIAGH